MKQPLPQAYKAPQAPQQQQHHSRPTFGVKQPVSHHHQSANQYDESESDLESIVEDSHKVEKPNEVKQ